MSSADILVSFLADIGDDWHDGGFHFPEPGDIDISSYIDDNFCDEDKLYTEIPFTSACSSPAYSNYTSGNESDTEEEKFQHLRERITVSSSNNSSSTNDLDEEERAVCKSLTTKKDKKRKFSSNYSKKNEHDKRSRQTPEEKVTSVISLLKEIKDKNKKSSPKNFQRHPNPVGATQSILNALLVSKSTNPQDLLKVFVPSAVLYSSAVSSLHSTAQCIRSKRNLAAWAPVGASLQAFPCKHTGVGQIAGASRAFTSSISDLLSERVAHKIQFTTSLLADSVVISPDGDRLASQFNWHSIGLVEQGFDSEIEFNGLIRCTFCKEGVSSVTISFDACTPYRQCERTNYP